MSLRSGPAGPVPVGPVGPVPVGPVGPVPVGPLFSYGNCRVKNAALGFNDFKNKNKNKSTRNPKLSQKCNGSTWPAFETLESFRGT